MERLAGIGRLPNGVFKKVNLDRRFVKEGELPSGEPELWHNAGCIKKFCQENNLRAQTDLVISKKTVKFALRIVNNKTKTAYRNEKNFPTF